MPAEDVDVVIGEDVVEVGGTLEVVDVVGTVFPEVICSELVVSVMGLLVVPAEDVDVVDDDGEDPLVAR